MPLERDGLVRDSGPRPDVATWPDVGVRPEPDSLSALDSRPATARRPGPGELPGAPPTRDGLLREPAPRPDAAAWPDVAVRPELDSLSALDSGPATARRPGAGELPAAPIEREDLQPESAAWPNRTVPPGQGARWEPPPSAEQPRSPSGTLVPDLPRPRPGSRPSLAAKLSLADLARVRQALALLSEDPQTAAERTDGDTGGPVPSSRTPDQQAGAVAARRHGEDETDTVPMPVVLHSEAGVASSGAAEPPPRAPFEPARPSQQSSQSEPEPTEEPGAAEPGDGLPPAAAAKLDQIKDLLITAEAIGEHNLDQHFEQVSQRQRELIREFFDQAKPGRDASA